MIRLEIDASAPIGALQILTDRERDFSDPLARVLTLALEDAVATIESGGAPFFWAPMSALTTVVAEKLYGTPRDPATLLRDKGGLVQSLTQGGPENIFDVGPKEGEAGSSYVSPRTGFAIARYQQEGTGRTFHVLQGSGFSEVGIPGREFLSWREDRVPEYMDIFSSYLFLGEE